MNKTEREDKLEEIKQRVEALQGFKINMDFSDVLNNLSDKLDEMLDNEVNESKQGYDNWNELKEGIEEFINCLDQVDLTYACTYTCNGDYSKKTRTKIINAVKSNFSQLQDYVNEIINNLADLKEECEEVSDNCDRGGVVAQYKDEADDMISEIETLETDIEPYSNLIDAVNDLLVE